jgi:hypothetical protein
LKRSTALMRPSRVLAGRKSGAEETEMELHEYDEFVRTLVRITAHQDLINQKQDLINQQQQLINERLELTLQAMREILQRGDVPWPDLYRMRRPRGMDFMRRGEDECLHGRFLCVRGLWGLRGP